MDNFDPNKCLSPHLAIRGVDDILYEYGISLTSVNRNTKRLLINSPKLIFIVLVTEILKSMAILMTDDNDNLRLRMLGDFAAFFHCKHTWSLICLLTRLLTLSIQLLYIKNYINGMKNEHYAIMQMMSGRRPPSSFGLYKQSDVIKILKYAKICNFIEKNLIVFGISNILLVLVPYWLYSTMLITLTFGIANSIPYSMVACYVYQIVFFNTIYFFIVCKYFNIKINNLNENLDEIKMKNILRKQVLPILRSMNRLYHEINVYNMFWSKYLFTIWLILGISLVLFLFMITFVSLILIIKLIIIYFTIMGTICLLGTYSLPSSVNYHANKTYEILNSLSVNKLSKTNKNERLLLYNKVKCNFRTNNVFFTFQG